MVINAMLFIGIIIICILARYLWLGVGLVVSGSMLPTLLINDVVLVNKLNKIPSVGDIFLFKKYNKIYIKRVALVNKNGVYFLGDNEKNSKDSRSFGYIKKDKLVGKVFKILFSFDEKYSIRWNRVWHGRL